MSFLEIITLGVALGADAFSVSMVLGTVRLRILLILKLGLLIGAFHIFMPFLGMNLGHLLYHFFGHYYFEDTINSVTQLIGSGVLMILGMLMIYEGVSGEEEDYNIVLTGWPVVMLALSVSIDALSVGFSLGMLDVRAIFNCLLFGLIAALMVMCGLIIGGKVGDLFSNKAQVLGGIILILLGVHFILSVS